MPDRQEQAAIAGRSAAAAADGARALLVCSDNASRRWGPRWLEHVGLEVTLCNRPAEAHDVARSVRPSVIIVEASLRDERGAPLYPMLQRAHTDAKVIVLCAGNRELQNALGHAEVHDVVRKPYDWQLISRRTQQILQWHANGTELARLRSELEAAQMDASQLRLSLQKSADTDPLTELPTRSKFRRLLGQTLASPAHAKTGMLVLVIRINRFRLVNEALGHNSGNDVLLEIAERLRETMGRRSSIGAGFATAALGRLGGISFSLALTGIEDLTRVRELSTTLLAELARPVQVGSRPVYLSASIGGALYPMDGEHSDELLQHAESAALEARERGGGFRLFREPLVAGSARLLDLDSMLHRAIDEQQFHVEYQPILDVAESRVVGAEALLRWNHPTEGAIAPGEFIPVAEKSGVMPQIGAFVLDRACQQLREWLDAGAGRLRMSVNLSLYELQHTDVVDTVAQALRAWQIDPDMIELELSERGVVGRDADVLRQLHLLKSIGIRLSIDDFGTGEASIAYLKELPIDALKIDRSYVSGASVSGRDATIAAGMAALARQLGLTVVAEGVETAGQLDLLRSWGCHQYQGFYFSPSVSAGRFLPLAARANQRIAASEGHVPGLS